MPLLFFGAWGRRRLREFVLGTRTDPSPALKPSNDFVETIFKNFRPRRGRLPVFSDAALRRLDMPVLAIVGARDVLLDSRETARCLRFADVRLLPAAGHLIRGQTEAIRGFLSSDSCTSAHAPGSCRG